MENSPSKTGNVPRPKRRFSRNLIFVTLLLLFVGLVAWGRFVAENQEVKIPNPVMPHPNAYDLYVTAGQKLVNAKLFETGNWTSVPLGEKEAVVLQNADVLQVLRQGFVYGYRNPPMRPLSNTSPQDRTIRSMAYLLALQSQVQGEKQDWGEAADSALDAIQLSVNMTHGAGLEVHLYGVRGESAGQQALWSVSEHLNASQARAAAQRMETLMEQRSSFADALQEHKWAEMAEIARWFHDTQAQGVLRAANSLAGNNASPSQRYSAVFFVLYGKQRALQEYAAYVDAVTAIARKPYPIKMPPPPLPRDLVDPNMAPVIGDPRGAGGYRFAEEISRMKSGMLLIELALRAYRLEHGRYPASLAEITPIYLKKLPDDPFALRGSFAYTGKSNTYTLYSVGPDGKDDGGKPIEHSYSAPIDGLRARGLMQVNSVGDIVAGSNLP